MGGRHAGTLKAAWGVGQILDPMWKSETAVRSGGLMARSSGTLKWRGWRAAARMDGGSARLRLNRLGLD